MKCDTIHPLIIDFLYDEITEENKKILQLHLKKCDKCREEVESLKSTSNILQKWEDVEPDYSLVMVTEKVPLLDNLKEQFQKLFPKPKKIAFGFAYGIVVIFLLLALANTEISYQQGNFKMSMGLFSKQPAQNQVEANEMLINQLVEKLQQENYYLMKTMIEQSEARQQKQWQSSLVQFNRNLEQQRIQDLNLIGSGLNNFEKNTYKKLERIDNSLYELFRPVNAQRK
ncbi:hypothetical protein H8E88_14435 [candidate division KSB1 bacterium]|nr:hypothetical protein [candidate division KSB1 bacterium]MBL7094816.1 hypothetical protein [candidate division KSB1 bacterium]